MKNHDRGQLNNNPPWGHPNNIARRQRRKYLIRAQGGGSFVLGGLSRCGRWNQFVFSLHVNKKWNVLRVKPSVITKRAVVSCEMSPRVDQFVRCNSHTLLQAIMCDVSCAITSSLTMSFRCFGGAACGTPSAGFLYLSTTLLGGSGGEQS